MFSSIADLTVVDSLFGQIKNTRAVRVENLISAFTYKTAFLDVTKSYMPRKCSQHTYMFDIAKQECTYADTVRACHDLQ